LEETGTDWRIRVQRKVKRLKLILWNGLIWHSVRKNDGCIESGNEKACSVKIGENYD
jgi:hypothetical protein